MNASMLIKFLPMLIMLVSLAYAAYTVQWLGTTLEPVLNQGAMKQAETKGALPSLANSRTQGPSPGIAEIVRDLFQIVGKPTPGEASNQAGSEPSRDAPDPYDGLVEGMTLNATWLQGRTQMAVINGRIYKSGQHLDDRDGQPTPLALMKVFTNKVILEAGGKHYSLAYPDNFDTAVAARETRRAPPDPAGLKGLDPQLAMIQALLRSSLGGLGARMLGKGGRDLVTNTNAQLGKADAGAASRMVGPSRAGQPVPTRSFSPPEVDP